MDLNTEETMSVERSLEAWEEVQRHGHDLADRLAQGFNGLIHINPPSFPSKLFDLEFSSQHFGIRDSKFFIDQPINGVSAIVDIGNKIGQAGVSFGAGLNVMVHQFFRRLPIPFWHDENVSVSTERDTVTRSHRVYVDTKENSGFSKTDTASSVTVLEEKVTDFDLRTTGLHRRPKVLIVVLQFQFFIVFRTGQSGLNFVYNCRDI